MWRQEHCRSCNALVVWTRTAFNHTAMPVDWDPVPHGNIVIVEHDGEPLRSMVLPPGDERINAETTYTSHFATCPDGDRWRRRTHA